ncbi:MAG: FAD-dependent oxidoreductase, partial [Deltaproteobacteria bacterium]
SEFVDVLHVSAGSNQTPQTVRRTIPLMSTPQGCYAYLAAEIREAVSVPVIAVGRIKRPEVAESILAAGQADMVAVGRGMIADAHWARKAEAGEEDQIRPCIACNQGCIEYLFLDRQITCLHNPTVGHERELALSPAEEKKKVLIIGGGVGGMEAARVAVLRGHDVELWEKTRRLGGNVNLATASPWKTEFGEVVDYLVRQLERLNVRVKLETDGTVDAILDYSPDVLLLATGGTPKELCDFDAGGAPMLIAEEVLSGQIGYLVSPVCVIGGGMVGVEVACLLAAMGHEVEVVEMLSDTGLDMGPINRAFWKDKLAELNVTVHTDCEVLGCEECSLRAKSASHTETHLLGPHGSYVIAVGYDPNDSLKRELGERAPASPFTIHSIGDCVFPRNALQAVSEGYRVAFSL